MLLAPLLLLGCTPGKSSHGLTLHAALDGVELSEVEAGEADDPAGAAPGRFDLVAAAGETVGFRVWVSHSGVLPANVSLTVEDFKGEPEGLLPANAVQLFRIHRVRMSGLPGWHVRIIEPDERREWVDDLLIPVHAPSGGLPARVSSREPLAVWADILVPAGAPAGVYLSKLNVFTGTGGGRPPAASLTLRLEVLPVVLPKEAGVVLAADLDHEQLFAHHITYEGRPYRPGRVLAAGPMRGEMQAVLDSAMRLLQTHGVSPLVPTLYPVMKIDGDGRVSVRWEDYDAMVEGYLDGSRFFDREPLPVWVVPFDEQFPTPPSGEALRSPAYSGYVRQYVEACSRHFAERGWLDRAFARIPHARAPSAEAVAASEHFAQIIRRAAPELRILSELFPQDLAPYGWADFPAGDLMGYVDVWCPPAQFLPMPRDRDRLKPAQTFWAQVDRPPYSGTLDPCAGPADARVLPWQARQEGVAVLRLGLANSWPEAPGGLGRLTAQDCLDAVPGRSESGRPRQSPLMYPGSIAGLKEPLPSLRLKRLRRGIIEMAWLRLLRDLGVGHIAEVLAESLAPFAGARAYGHHYADGRPGGWVRDPRVWREAERIMVDEIRAASGMPSRMERMAATVRWRQFMESARRLRASVESVRVSVVGRGERTSAGVECALRLDNGNREPLSGSIRFGTLPVGWTAPEEPVSIGPIAPGHSGRAVLSAKASAVPWNEDGVHYLPVELHPTERMSEDLRRLVVRLAYVAAQPLGPRRLDSSAEGGTPPEETFARRPGPQRRIRIDGDLGDWPAAAGNLASDFVLITGEDPATPGEPRTRATARTRVSVAADGEALYFGFDCAYGKGGVAALLGGHANTVRYEDMIPMGDELAEIVIDPTAAGTHSPADLYHVVIMPGGAIWERGVGVSPPVGRREAWAADIQHAAKVGLVGWTAEVRIALSAFGPTAMRQPIWAVNFARFDARGQEYSTWSGASGDFYDPAAAGNLALP